MPTSTARTMKGPRRFARRHDRRSESPRWQFLRGFLKNPVMVGSIIPSSRILIEKMLAPSTGTTPGCSSNTGRASAPSPARSSTGWGPTRRW